MTGGKREGDREGLALPETSAEQGGAVQASSCLVEGSCVS